MSLVIQFNSFVPNKGFLINLENANKQKFMIDSVHFNELWEPPEEILLEFKEYVEDTDKMYIHYVKLIKCQINETTYSFAYPNGITYVYTHSDSRQVYIKIKDLINKGRNEIIANGTLTIKFD